VGGGSQVFNNICVILRLARELVLNQCFNHLYNFINLLSISTLNRLMQRYGKKNVVPNEIIGFGGLNFFLNLHE